MRHCLYILLVLALFAPWAAGAQDKTMGGTVSSHNIYDYDRSYSANPRYRYYVRRAIRHQPEDFDFSAFRLQYVHTSQYDPFGERTREKILQYAYTVQHSEDEKEVDDALAKYQRLVADHLAHIGIVTQVLALAAEDKRFGNVKFFRWLKRGLMNEVLTSGDGKTLDGAYDVMTLDEEAMLIRWLNFKLVSTEPRRSGYLYYNMHTVESLETGRKFTLFVNTTYPLSKAAKLAERPDYSVNVRPQ